MSASTTVLRAAFETLHRSGLASMLRPWSQGLGVILCMHSVQPEQISPDGFSPNAGLSSTPSFLDAALSMLRSSGYEFVSLDAAAARIRDGGKDNAPFAVFTLDDGYRDNLVHALPVFQKHECPFTVYVTPGFVDAETEMWWLALERIIASNTGRLDVAGAGVELDGSVAAKWVAWSRLAPLVQNLGEHEQRKWIRDVSARFGLDLAGLCRELIMTWDEVRRLASDPLATIGAHTLHHFAVSRLTEDEARREIRESGERIVRETGRPVKHFAYPYGNVGHAGVRDFRLAAEAGYETAVTTRMGAVYPEHAGHMQALPRVMVSSKYAEARWLKVLASGLPGRMANLGGRLIVA